MASFINQMQTVLKNKSLNPQLVYQDSLESTRIHRTDSYSTTGTFTGALNINGDNRGWSWYGSLGNGWVGVLSFTVTVGHSSDGSGSCGISGSVNGPSGTSLSGKTSSGGSTVTLDKIDRYATVTSGTNFNDEGNPTIKFSNPAGYRINARLEFGGAYIQRDNIPNTGTYTFELTNEERELLRSKCPNSNSLTGREVIATCTSGTTEGHWDWSTNTMTIVNANPTFSNFTFEDDNTITKTLTGNNQNIIKNYSNVKVTISTANKAIALKGSTMSKYRFAVGNNSTDITYSDNSSVNGTINKVDNGTFNVYATDSRNNSTLVTKLANSVIEYEPIVLDGGQCSATRDDGGVGTNVTLNIGGTIWNKSFGSVTNSIKSIKYYLKETSSSEWIEGRTVITPVLSGNSFSWSGLIKSDEDDYEWLVNKSYDIKIEISDELSSKTLQLTPISSGIPNISFADNGVGIMCDYDESLGGYLQVGGIRVDGEIYSTDEMLIGKWEDGKNLYRKTIYITNITGTEYKYDLTNLSSASGISNISYCSIEKAEFEFTYNNYDYVTEGRYVDSTDYFTAFRRTQGIRQDYIRFRWGTVEQNATNKMIRLILRYTKSSEIED